MSQLRQHPKSDCGHYQVKRSHSLLRNFSLRSRNSFKLKSNPPPPLPLPSFDSPSPPRSPDTPSLWKKWRLKFITNLNIQGSHAQEMDVIDPQGSAKKRSFFWTVTRHAAPFQSSSPSSSSSDDSPCVVLPHLTRQLSNLQDEEERSSNSIRLSEHESFQIDFDVNIESELKLTLSPPFSIPLTSPSSPPSTPESSTSQKRRAKFTLGDESDLNPDSLAVSISTSSEVTVAVSSLSLASGANDHRPSLTREERYGRGPLDQIDTTASMSATTKSARRWTLSSALTDDGISDEGLVKELERMRKILEWDVDMDAASPLFSSTSPPPTPCNPWMVTQRALLTTRELILTERHYLSSLLLLLCPGSTLTPVPEMMLSYVKALVCVSERLLRGMEAEPSVRGVAEAFVDVGGLSVDGAESAFVGWCGVVGGWFQGDTADTQAVDAKRKRKRLTSSIGGSEELPFKISDQEGSGVTLGEQAHTSPLMRNVSTWRKSMPSIAGLGESGVWKRDKEREGDSSCGPTFDAVQSKATNIVKPLRKLAVRDLAILPTQRVMRYVLLYRDLLANTPSSSSSYPIVEHAVETACKIAEKCDRAQDNTTFLAGGSSSSSSTRDSSSTSGSSSTLSPNNSQRFNGKRGMTLPEPSLKLKSGWGSSSGQQSGSATSSPTRSHFFSSSPAASTTPSPPPPSTSSALPRLSPKKVLPPVPPVPPIPTTTTTTTITKKRSAAANMLPPLVPPPPSSFHSKIPILRSDRSLGSLSTTSSSAGSNSNSTTPSSSSSSSSSQCASPVSYISTPSSPPPSLLLCLPKTTSFLPSSNVSSRLLKPLSTA